MSEHLEKLLRRSLQQVQQLRAELKQTRNQSREPIAVLSVACRVPGGVTTPQEYWELLAQGREVVEPFPTRWPPHGELQASGGGFLRDVSGFDAEFFSISPREALAMDPQQRLILELAWEVLEGARLNPRSLGGSPTGVFLGTQGSDYGWLHSGPDVEGYLASGQAASVLSGRLSYLFNLGGPCMSVDTACSSSLVAVHLACQALRQGECELALAGGVQVMSTAAPYLEFGRLGAISQDGRCRSYSDQADGTNWAEGAGLVLLKPLSLARRDGDPILALIPASALNQDGRTQGLTAPSAPGQARVIRAALEAAQWEPEEIDVIEGHGTGTRLGDPIELRALHQVFARTPIWLGSSKSNFGHAQAAAGILALIKMILALGHERLPKTLHAETGCAEFPWSDSGLKLLTQEQPWRRRPERIRRAGISAFGMSGTNAHLLLQEAPPEDQPQHEPRALPTVALVLSGRTPGAVLDNARALARWLETAPPVEANDLAFSLAATRASFTYRTTLMSGPELDDLPARLRGELTVSRCEEGKLAVMFSGQGSQRPGMGMALLDQPGFEVFTHAYREAAAACDRHLPRPLFEVITEGEELDSTLYTQPSLFALETALYRQWQSPGFRRHCPSQ